MARLFGRFRRSQESVASDAEAREELERSVAKTRGGQLGALRRIFTRSRIDDDFWEELEETLILGDVGGAVAMRWVEEMRDEADGQDAADVRGLLRRRMIDGLDVPSADGLLWNRNGTTAELATPHVVLVVGVNGAGKTTSIAKLAQRLSGRGRVGPAGRGRHLPRGRDRAAADLGRPAQRAGDRAPAGLRPRRGRV